MLEIAGLGAAPAVFQGFGLVNNLITNNSLMIYGNNEMGAGGGDLAISALSVVNTVESIALSVGYQNVEHFNRLFKKAFNMTPVQFRNKK